MARGFSCVGLEAGMMTYDMQATGVGPDRMVATDDHGRQVCLVDASRVAEWVSAIDVPRSMPVPLGSDIFCELRAECARHLGEDGFDASGAIGRELENALAYVGVQVAMSRLAADDAEAAVVMWLGMAMAHMADDMYQDLADYTFSPERLDEIAAAVGTRMRQ